MAASETKYCQESRLDVIRSLPAPFTTNILDGTDDVEGKYAWLQIYRHEIRPESIVKNGTGWIFYDQNFPPSHIPDSDGNYYEKEEYDDVEISITGDWKLVQAFQRDCDTDCCN